MRLLSATALVFGDGHRPPALNGAMVVNSEGRIEAIGAPAELKSRYPRAQTEHHQAVLTPGLVNAHTHLELSALRGQVAGGHGFVPWLRELMLARTRAKPELDFEAMDAGVGALLRFGTAAVGEVTNSLRTVEALASAPLLGRVFHEVFGVQRGPALAELETAQAARAAIHEWPRSLSYTLSPHTPYSMHPELLDAILEIARASKSRVSMHVAEHAAERAFMTTGGGPLKRFLSEVGRPADFPPPQQASVPYLASRGALSAELIAVHLADARPDEIAQIAEAGCPVVLCPRSNLHIEVRLPPLVDLLAAGIRPGLGTDSLASAPDLDVMGEARALHARYPSVSSRTLLAMAMHFGAEALGLVHQLGRIDVGLCPGIIAFPHRDGCGMAATDPERFVLETKETKPRQVLCRPRCEIELNTATGS